MIAEYIEDLIRPAVDASRIMTSKGWCREAAGNISILIDDIIGIGSDETFIFDSGQFLPRLEGKTILMTRSGSFISEVPQRPEQNLGLYRIGKGGRYLSLVWGEGAPTSEYLSHLLIYGSTGGRVKAVIHSHMDDVDRLARELPDIAYGLPRWIGWVPRIPPGSIELARATVREIERCDIMVWQGHGVLSPGKDVEDCLSRLERFEEWAKGIL
ncbi:MAG: class II aldolase/adducin family protein [Thermoplasmatota archaeon]